MAEGYAQLATTSRDQSLPPVPHADSEGQAYVALDGSGDLQGYQVLHLRGHDGVEAPLPGLEAVHSLEAKVEGIEERLSTLRVEEDELQLQLVEFDRAWRARRQGFVREIRGVSAEIQRHSTLRSALLKPALGEDFPSGPVSLRWVDGPTFILICTIVLIVNTITLIFQAFRPQLRKALWPLDQAFLVWYLIELSLRFTLHRGGFLCGFSRDVAYHWLDVLVVTGGILDQWLEPFIKFGTIVPEESHRGSSSISTDLRLLRALRLMRLFRIMRILKMGKFMMEMDLAWAEGRNFHSFIMCVIALNTVSIGCELDIEWAGWYWIEQGMLSIYLFEIVVRIKHRGFLRFFCHPQDVYWNCLDFVVVSAGVVDQWMLPATALAMSVVTGQEPQKFGHMGDTIVVLLRITRLLRVLRLVKLVKQIEPLHRLMRGIVAAADGVRWVLFLTVVLLYAFAIVATSLLGHGLIFGGHIPEEAKGLFSSVPQSMFLLFKLMNDDQSVMDKFFGANSSKVLFVVFMVVTNWSMLAILTATVSENMITATHKDEEQKALEQLTTSRSRCTDRLRSLFRELDVNEDRTIDLQEFRALLGNRVLSRELCEASCLKVRDLQELFLFLSHQDENGDMRIYYDDFIDKMQEAASPVVERSVYRLEKKVHVLEDHLDQRFREVMEALGKGERRDVMQRQKSKTGPNWLKMHRDEMFGQSQYQALLSIHKRADVHKDGHFGDGVGADLSSL